jgi:hypothetical protein
VPFDQFAPKVWLPLGVLTCLVVFVLSPVRGDDHIADSTAAIAIGVAVIGLPLLNALVHRSRRR